MVSTVFLSSWTLTRPHLCSLQNHRLIFSDPGNFLFLFLTRRKTSKLEQSKSSFYYGMLMGNDDVIKQKVSSDQKPEGYHTWTHQNLNGPGLPGPLGLCPLHAHSQARSRPCPRRAVRVPVLQVVTPPPPFSTIPAAPVRSGPVRPVRVQTLPSRPGTPRILAG